MDLRKKLKVAWRDAFNGDVPAEVLSRLDCENDIELPCISILTGARHKTWEVLSEVELRLQQEKFLLQFIEDEIKAEELDNSDKKLEKPGVESEMDNMYAKVNKPLKSKQRDSEEIDDKHSNKSDQASSAISQIDTSYEEVAFRSCAPVGKTKSDPVDRRGSYEEVSFQPSINIRPESLGKKEKKKVKGSVRDRIKKFEKSSSKDGDEIILDKSDSDSSKTPPNPISPKPPPPVVSPRPSPAVRKRQQQNNTYEEILLPHAETTEMIISESSETPGNPSMSTNLSTADTRSDSKHRGNQKDESSVEGCEVLKQTNCEPSLNKTSAEIPILVENKANDTVFVNDENDHYASIKDTVKEPTVSEKEPTVSSARVRDIKVSEENDHYALLKVTAKEPTFSEKEPTFSSAKGRNTELNDEIDLYDFLKETVEEPEETEATISTNKLKDIEVTEENDSYASLKETAKELGFSDKESSVPSAKGSEIKVSHFKPINKDEDDDLEGDYCSLSDITKYADKHKTLIEVKSGGSQKSDSEQETNNIAKQNTSSNLHIVSSTISRSTEDLSHYKDIDDDNIESINEEKEAEMKKLFSKKNECDLTSSFVDGTSSVIGKTIKSLSSSDSDEENTGKTLPFSGENHKLKPRVSKEPPKPSARGNRKRIPDYEKWNFQALLTNPDVSVAETANFAEETASEDDLSPRIEKRFEHKHDKTVKEQNGLSDTNGSPNSQRRSISPKSPRRSGVPSGKYSPQFSPRMRKGSTMSENTEGSRISTASVSTIQGDPVSLQRLDSVDGQYEEGKSADDDSVSILSLEDQLDDEKEIPVDKKRADQLRMRHLVVKGILESEKSYLHLIEQLVKAKNFLHMRVAQDPSQKISMEDITTIFYMMDQIYQKHKEFVDSLKEKVEHWSDEQTIGESFKIMVLYFKLYEDYVKNYPKVLEVLPKYQENEDTWQLFEEQMELFQESSKLEDILLKPVQRMQRNTLVLHDLIKHTPEDHPDYDVLKRALKLSEENLKTYNMQSNPIQSNNFQEARQLIKNGFVVEVSADKKMTRHLRYLFLFSDLVICTKHKAGSKHREGSFKFCWSLPLCQLKMHVKGESKKYDTKESLEELKMKIGNLKVELRDEMVKEDNVKDKSFSIIQRKPARNIEKLKKKIQEHEATLVEALPCLPLNLDTEGQRPHVLLFSTDYERQEWREAIDAQWKKFQDVPLPQLSLHDMEALINGTKLHTHVNGIGTVLLRKDEEVLNGNLNVTIHKLQGLDYACDTYCCLEMDSYGHFYKKAQTRTCFNMYDPSWDEDFELDLDGSQTLRILCYKRRPGDEDDIVIGKCALELSLTWLNSKFNEKTITMHNISITISIRHTPASKTMKRTQSKMMNGIFGVRIEYVTRRENRTVPPIVTVCCQEVEKRALNEVGIYRVSGVTSEVQHLKKMFDKNLPAAMHQVEDADIHAVTGVLKLYFRELPEPLFTDKQYKSFIQTVELKDEDSKEKCMLDLLHSLPDANYYTIAFMIEHLVRVAKKSSENKMSINNLATIFGPTLLHPAVKETDVDPMLQIARAAHDASVQSEVVHYFIKLAASGRNIRKSAQTLAR